MFGRVKFKAGSSAADGAFDGQTLTLSMKTLPLNGISIENNHAGIRRWNSEDRLVAGMNDLSDFG
jgi:hypothetical protein